MNYVYVELYKGVMGKFRWRVKSVRNSQNMANGSQGYVHKVDALHGMCRVLGAKYDPEKDQYTRCGEHLIVVDLTKKN